MSQHGLLPLATILRRMVYSFILSIIGCWGLIIPRLNVISEQKFKVSSEVFLYLDLASLALAFLGVTLILYYKHLIIPRLNRIDTLGESRW